MKKLIRTFKQISILILAITLVGCEEDDTNLPKVLAGFTYTINADTGVVTFINLSTEATNYSWDLGDGSSSTLINPVNAYENGTYTVTLRASVPAGSSSTFQDEITILIPEEASIPLTFDGANTNYDAGVFGGASFAVVDNPAPGGSNNTASKVGAITNIGATFEGIVFELGESLKLADGQRITMDFWSVEPVSVTVKLEISENEFTDVTVSHGGTGWEALSFDFSGSGTYPKLVIFVDGAGTTAGTFYFDNIGQEEKPEPLCTPETEESLNAADVNITFLSDPEVAGGGITIFEDNVTYEYADNPDGLTDANSSCKVGKITKSGVQPWDNLQINFADKFTFADGDNFTIKVYSPVAGYNVTMKLEDKATEGAVNSGDVLSTTQTTKTNEWEELTIPFNAVDSGKYDKMVIFFDLQGVANTNVYYIDDIKLNSGNGGGGGGNCVADAAQSINAANLDLTFATDPGTIPTRGTDGKFFEDNVTYEYVDNPDFSAATNNSCKVGKVTKSNVQPWDNLQLDFADKFTFTDGDNFTIKVFSPQSGYKVTLKLEDKTTEGAVNSGDRESTTSTTKTNEWEELTIPFGAADSGKYDKIVIFFDLSTASTNTYYFDDLKLNSGTGGGGGGGGNDDCTPPAGELLANGGFETDTCWQFNPDSGTSERSSAEANTGTFSARLVTGAAQVSNIKMESFAKNAVVAGDVVQVALKYKFTTGLGTGSQVKIEGFTEKTEGADAQNLTIISQSPTLNQWLDFTGTFTVTAGLDPSRGISLLILLEGSGNADGAGEIFVDDVKVTKL